MDFPFERQNERKEIKVCVIKWQLIDLEIEITEFIHFVGNEKTKTNSRFKP